MEREEIHQLTAAYALDALNADDERAFEEHLRHCEPCRLEVATMLETAADLAHLAPATRPSDALRVRILERARAERGNVVPLRRRWAIPVAAAAAVAACAAIGLGVWATMLSHSLTARTDALRGRDQALAILATPGARQIPLASGALLAVAPTGRAALVASSLRSPPNGRTYEAWVVAGGAPPEPAGLFTTRDGRGTLVLTRLVERGARVAVTVEPARGSPQPTGRLVFRSTPT